MYGILCDKKYYEQIAFIKKLCVREKQLIKRKQERIKAAIHILKIFAGATE